MGNRSINPNSPRLQRGENCQSFVTISYGWLSKRLMITQIIRSPIKSRLVIHTLQERNHDLVWLSTLLLTKKNQSKEKCLSNTVYLYKKTFRYEI
jgi:hypothetical protein